ncbi:sodium-dependent transporter [Iodobacter fluviatilis]|uniref:Transporter n=1 Tax=Iodobacter fluviatilis TaxID=537 RepID=A0A377Q6X3_9NEIS|nr:sodium-dependent transporter [Iodobacter fluviatilis]TCU89223.1 NSS family neurotransmitter:Na+ symporter [Iodobacter fluviatilis]STQ90592.1 Na+-dependent transporters of the SNF family [Iodobacter fluviatilis]
MSSSSRDGFTSTFGVLVATLGSAVGLGNIWKFPYLTGTNGGASFLLVYIIATLLVGLPVMITEIMLGRASRANAITTFEKLVPKNQGFWKLTGYMGVAAAVLILAFYTEVAGWVFAYIFKALSGQLSSVDPSHTKAVFGELVANPQSALIWQWLVLGFTGTIIMCGVSKGIEAVSKKLMPILFLLLIALCIRSLTLPGAMHGLEFLFTPDFSKINAAVILTAVGLAFFKLSIGMGTMLTYGSYFRAEQNIPLTATRVMFADLTVSLLAGIAIFPAVFAFGFEPAAGPSLVFITIPAVFHSMPGGSIFMALFFILTAIAATGAILSILEVPVAMLIERCDWSRKKATAISILIIAFFGLPAALSQSLTSNLKFFGLNTFDLFDYISSNILMPVGGILICLFAGWSYGLPKLKEALSNSGTLNNSTLIKVLFILLRYIAPLLIGIILLNGFGWI